MGLLPEYVARWWPVPAAAPAAPVVPEPDGVPDGASVGEHIRRLSPETRDRLTAEGGDVRG